MTIHTETAFDLTAFKRAVESGWDVGAILPLYDEDAEYVTVDKNNPPSSPRVLRGRTAIGEYLKEAAAHGVASRIDHAVVSDGRAALTFNCKYPTGSGCSATACPSSTMAGSSARRTSRPGTSRGWRP